MKLFNFNNFKFVQVNHKLLKEEYDELAIKTKNDKNAIEKVITSKIYAELADALMKNFKIEIQEGDDEITFHGKGYFASETDLFNVFYEILEMDEYDRNKLMEIVKEKLNLS